MRLRNIPRADSVLAESIYVLENKEEILDYVKDSPLYLEIGMGKGRFINGLSELYPENKYIGVELYSSVLLRAVENIEEEEEIRNNVRYLNCNATNLKDYLNEKSVSGIYLNFSDPWPKRRMANRRLTSTPYLKLYEYLLKEGGKIEQKTDNRDLFDFSVKSFQENNWKLELVTYDLHSDEELMKTNVMTEYEEKFSSKGNPICKLIASKN